MSAMEAAIDRAVAVVASRSTASVVPSPTLLPNPMLEPSAGGSVSRSSSAVSSLRRAFSETATSSQEWLKPERVSPTVDRKDYRHQATVSAIA